MQQYNDNFQGLGIAPKLLQILQKNNFTIPTPIQRQSIPAAITGKDIIGIAQTGTGKTLAFGVPMLQSLALNKGRGLVVVPTRELAVQVDEALHKIGRPLGLKTAVLIGGEDIKRQMRKLRINPHIFVVTPGRLIDHLQQGTVSLDAVRILVLDEADRMLDMGFAPQIRQILSRVPQIRQTMLFSATMPQEIVTIAARYMKLPVRVEVAPSGTAARDVSQEIYFVEKEKKLDVLAGLLYEYRGSILIFTRTKYGAKRLARAIRDMDHAAAELHSNRSLSQRSDALSGFKLGKYRVLVATDIAARGIDVVGIELVINYDLPSQAEDYVHRIGRTGRAGAIGHAISFAMPHERGEVANIERVIRMALPISPKHNLASSRSFPGPRSARRPFRDKRRPRFSRRRR